MSKKIILIICTFCLFSFVEAQENKPDTVVHNADTAAPPKKQGKKFSVAGIPLLSFDQTKGTGFGGIAMAFFKLDSDPETKPSSISVMGKYTLKDNWYASAMANLFFTKDRYRLMFGGGYMNSNFQALEVIDYSSVEVPYNNHGGFLFFIPYIRVWNQLYVGVGGQMFKSHLDLDFPDPIPDSISINWMNSLALNTTFDTRDSPYNPSKGVNSTIRFNYFPDWMENVDTYYKIHAEGNYYWRIDHSKVLASRLSMNIGMGDLPFVGQSYVGNRDIRGYTKGEYRGDQTYAIQSELRWNFYRRWGAVGFFGLALATTPKTDYVSPVLPGGGIGARYMVLSNYHINLGIDGAVGKDDWGVYFRITEAF